MPVHEFVTFFGAIGSAEIIVILVLLLLLAAPVIGVVFAIKTSNSKRSPSPPDITTLTDHERKDCRDHADDRGVPGNRE